MFVLVCRFTELYVEEPTSTADLSVMIQDYLKNDCPSNPLVEGIVRYWLCRVFRTICSVK